MLDESVPLVEEALRGADAPYRRRFRKIVVDHLVFAIAPMLGLR